MSIDSLPQPIKTAILNEANGFDNYEALPNSYHITELVGCIRKTLPKKPVNLETANNFHRGKLWDKDFCSRFRHNQIRVTYRCQRVPISISGHFDFLNQDDPQNPIITDLKAPKTLFYVEREGKPSEHYRQQVLFYCYCTAISKGAIMYWDGSKPLTFPVEVTNETCNKLIIDLETKTEILYIAIKNCKAPPRHVCTPESWECNYCEFSEECNHE